MDDGPNEEEITKLSPATLAGAETKHSSAVESKTHNEK